VVVGQEVQRLLLAGRTTVAAVAAGTSSAVRAVLSTTAVAALGFLPMALSSGAGSEVQRPLATAVSVGIVFGALTTLFVLPGLLVTILRRFPVRPVVVAPDATAQ
jgi:cobalt-zinc-cadmium resistance protein CzcA